MEETSTYQDTVLKIKNKNRETLKQIYAEAYPMVEQHILKNSGTKMDAQDIFHDALYILIQKANSQQFQLTAKPSTFLVGIAKNLWFKGLNKSAKMALIKDEQIQDEVELINEEEIDKLSLAKQVYQHIIQLGEPCRTILEEFYYFKTPLKEIAKKLHYTDANNAKNQKYKCFVRLKKSLGVAIQKHG